MENSEFNDDLTARARIRLAALKLFATNGSDATSMREISSQASVTLGLITHHFGNKAGLTYAVEEHIIASIRHAIAYKPSDKNATGVIRTLDRRLIDYLHEKPLVAAYLRRTMLVSSPNNGGSDFTQRFTKMALNQIEDLRARGIASKRRRLEDQTLHVMLVKLGQVLIEPYVCHIAALLSQGATNYRLRLSNNPN